MRKKTSKGKKMDQDNVDEVMGGPSEPTFMRSEDHFVDENGGAEQRMTVTQVGQILANIETSMNGCHLNNRD